MTLSNGPFGDRGLGTVDYILAAILIALCVMFIVNQFGGVLRGRFTVAGGCVDGLQVVDGEQWIACIPTPTPVPTSTPTTIPSPTLVPTATRTPRPTATATPRPQVQTCVNQCHLSLNEGTTTNECITTRQGCWRSAQSQLVRDMQRRLGDSTYCASGCCLQRDPGFAGELPCRQPRYQPWYPMVQ